MLTAKEIKSLAERVAKAEALVASGAVFPVAGVSDYYVVRNGNGEQFYLVHVKADEVCCSCPDYQNRQQAAGQACKHGHAVLLYREQPQPVAPAPVKRSKKTDAPREDARPVIDGAAALARLQGEDADPWNTPAAA